MAAHETLPDDAPASRRDLCGLFAVSEKPREQYLIGAESEKILVFAADGSPLEYAGDRGVCRIFRHLEREHGWRPFGELPGGPTLGLKRERASITLEPGAQFELSGAPLADVHAIAAEQANHLSELTPIMAEMGLEWLTVGFQPLARLDQLPWVPKQRYPIMREYLPTRGGGALDMMQRTATVQANFDWSSEQDGLRKLRVALRLSPLVHALFANSPFIEGRASGLSSERGRVWLDMDPSRSGLIERLWGEGEFGYRDYVEFALGAGMFLFWRDGQPVRNTGQTFADFLDHGFEGHRATVGDFRLHLTTLFPEVRLKNTLEVRSADALPPDLTLALVALWTGLLYDEQALGEVEAAVSVLRFEEVQKARPQLVRSGLKDIELGGSSGFAWAERLLGWARGGLERRASAVRPSEAVYLEPIERLVAARRSPADEVLERYRQTGSIVAAARWDRTRLG
ncbi:MAG TPA: glutamate-cysteine ligase family protein [Polyangiaceae bacterium]|nr:glutamate-cysteine ligase family protein [Polyangiaceae bacterium]